ncbi:DUF6502 family protein [Abyssibacter sp.]|uniref:DUF6502 family protein n=1 Tax=Abyssibacter sp. TaxID=2320200 RepID=UPI0025C1B571|nr:DUF6502 family protein [Abyssibacter sp.]MCK5858397.1 hypothetical protein [Abyssibacter sp.]
MNLARMESLGYASHSMDMDAHSQLDRALRRLLRPLVRIMLRQGISFGEFSEIAKRTYMEIAWDEFTPSDARASDSRVAIMTGLTRKEVKRLRETRAQKTETSTNHMNRATRVLSGWFRDPDFCDEKGQPRRLNMTDDGLQFPALVRRYSGDMPPRAMLEELRRVNAVRVDEKGIQVLSRSFVPAGGDPDSLRMFGLAMSDLGHTIDRNLNDGTSSEELLFQRYVSNAQLNPRMVPLFKRLLAERGMQLLESLDDWMSSNEQPDDAAGSSAHIGAGIYFFDRTDQPPTDD